MYISLFTLACDISLEASALCTMTWSEHQYQMDEIAKPNVSPDHGRSLAPNKTKIDSFFTFGHVHKLRIYIGSILVEK